MEQQEMTLQQALSVLDQAAAMAPLARQGHVTIQAALQVIAKFIQENTEEKDESK